MPNWTLLVLAIGLAPSVAAAAAPFPRNVVKKEQPKLEFQMVNAPWREVFKWLGNSTEVPVCVTCTPTGTFTFVGQRGTKYTAAQIVDIINQALMQQDCYLFRRPRCYTLYFETSDFLLA